MADNPTTPEERAKAKHDARSIEGHKQPAWEGLSEGMREELIRRENSQPTTPTPGSDKALSLGCKCPVIDNGRGRGVGGQFWMSGDCPLHGFKLEGGDEQ